MISHRFNHRCLSCWNSWYTAKRDAKALCPKCLSDNLELYVLSSHAKRGERALALGLLGWAVAATVVAVVAVYFAFR